jgi:NAD-dependent deacetylase
MENLLYQAAQILKNSRHAVVFTGAGISVESGVPPFRGDGGLWNKYDPRSLELSYFLKNPKESWTVLKEIFYDFLADARPNPAHLALARLENKGIVKSVITQNIDNLHQIAGNTLVYEFHGNTRQLRCLECGRTILSESVSLNSLPPRCNLCQGLLKPDIVFFSEMIPPGVSEQAFAEAEKADVMLVVGSTGEVMPAAYVPFTAKERNNAMVIEVNPEKSHFTKSVTDIFLKGPAGDILPRLTDLIGGKE